MRKSVLLLLTSMALAVLLAGGMAWAATVNCSPDANKCVGTSGPNILYGTGDDYDNIRGREGADKIYDLGGDDRTIHSEGLYGEGDDFIRAGDSTRDRIYCGLGHDSVLSDNVQGNHPDDRRDFVDDSCEDVTRR